MGLGSEGNGMIGRGSCFGDSILDGASTALSTSMIETVESLVERMKHAMRFLGIPLLGTIESALGCPTLNACSVLCLMVCASELLLRRVLISIGTERVLLVGSSTFGCWIVIEGIEALWRLERKR